MPGEVIIKKRNLGSVFFFNERLYYFGLADGRNALLRGEERSFIQKGTIIRR